MGPQVLESTPVVTGTSPHQLSSDSTRATQLPAKHSDKIENKDREFTPDDGDQKTRVKEDDNDPKKRDQNGPEKGEQSSFVDKLIATLGNDQKQRDERSR